MDKLIRTFVHMEPVDCDCGGCGTVFTQEIVLVTTLTSSLPDDVRSHALQSLTCPNCGVVTLIDAPLLVCNLDGDPPLILSSALGSTPQEDYEQATYLVDRARSVIGPRWRPEWEERVALVPRVDLATVLAGIIGRTDVPPGLEPNVMREFQRLAARYGEST